MRKTLLALVCCLGSFSTYASPGTNHMIDIMQSVSNGNISELDPATRKGVESGMTSAQSIQNTTIPEATLNHTVQQANSWQQLAREAYVAALPAKDRALGQSLLLGDGTLPGANGKLYFFVSRAMPMSLLKAYALEALYTGGTLVVKGLRKGDTVKEYVNELVADANSADGQILAGMEINPNLFDMFDVQVVPAVVWTNLVGLDDIGSNCQNLPEGSPVPQLSVTGPDDVPIVVDKPTCAKAANTAFYKLSGAITLPYVFDRFEAAGAPKEAMAAYRALLADSAADVYSGTKVNDIGNAMRPITQEIHLNSLPPRMLLSWQEQLQSHHVSRGPYGPIFSNEVDDDPAYREELLKKIRHELGVVQK